MNNPPTIEDLLEVLHVDFDLNNKEEITSSLRLITDVQKFTSAEISTLEALFISGPLFDGDVPTKSGRDELVVKGYACRIIVKGLEGYNACTQKGYWAYHLVKCIYNI